MRYARKNYLESDETFFNNSYSISQLDFAVSHILYRGLRVARRHPARSWSDMTFDLMTDCYRLSPMILRDLTATNMGRGAYDTTGVPKPPPPKPR